MYNVGTEFLLRRKRSRLRDHQEPTLQLRYTHYNQRYIELLKQNETVWCFVLVSFFYFSRVSPLFRIVLAAGSGPLPHQIGSWLLTYRPVQLNIRICVRRVTATVESNVQEFTSTYGVGIFYILYFTNQFYVRSTTSYFQDDNMHIPGNTGTMDIPRP